MPIGSDEDGTYDEWKRIYEEIIRPSVENGNHGIKCFRSDEEFRVGGITGDIIEHLHKDILCIADVTTHNPNVYYELGLRDVWLNETIIITQDSKDLQFDKKDDRAFKYHPKDIAKIREFDKKISKCIEDLLRNPGKTRNKVQEYLALTGTPNQEITKIERVIVHPYSTELRNRIKTIMDVTHNAKVEIDSIQSGVEMFYDEHKDGNVDLSIIFPRFGYKRTSPSYIPEFKKILKELHASASSLSPIIRKSPFGQDIYWGSVKGIRIIIPFESLEVDIEKFAQILCYHYDKSLEQEATNSVFTGLWPSGWNYDLKTETCTINVWDSERVAKLERDFHLIA